MYILKSAEFPLAAQHSQASCPGEQEIPQHPLSLGTDIPMCLPGSHSELTTDLEALQSQATHTAPEQARESKDRDCELGPASEDPSHAQQQGQKSPTYGSLTPNPQGQPDLILAFPKPSPA